MRQADYIHLMLINVNDEEGKNKECCECLSCDVSGALTVSIKKTKGEKKERNQPSLSAQIDKERVCHKNKVNFYKQP